MYLMIFLEYTCISNISSFECDIICDLDLFSKIQLQSKKGSKIWCQDSVDIPIARVYNG